MPSNHKIVRCVMTSPDYGNNACLALEVEDRARLWRAAQILAEERGLIVTVTAALGGLLGKAGESASDAADKMFGQGWREKVNDVSLAALRSAYDVGTAGLDTDGERDPWTWFHKIVVSVTGFTTGLVGLPGAVADLPITTSLIMRSVAEIARAEGEDISDPNTRMGCIEVFAFGGPEADDDGAEVGYWATRAGLSHATVELAIRTVAARFSTVVSEKMMAQAVPVAGGIAAAVLNYSFMNFYQQMARVHFAIRAVERKYGGDGPVRPCFDSLIHQIRQKKKNKND